MPSALLSPLDRGIRLIPLSVLKRVVKRDLTVIFYHSFTSRPLPHVTPLYACKSAEAFERDLLYLKENFRLVSHDDIVAHREGKKPLPPNAAAITFDDGFAECFSVARPLLLRHQMPASFFIVKNLADNRSLMHRNKIALFITRLQDLTEEAMKPLLARASERFGTTFGSRSLLRRWAKGLGFRQLDRIDALCELLGVDAADFLEKERPYMTTDQIACLHRDGFTIGAHTSDHPELGKLLDWAEVHRQVTESCNHVREITGRSRVAFAFPFNGIDLKRDALARLRSDIGSIDLMYDTNNLMRDRDFIVNRIWCDEPAGLNGQSNLRELLQRAHAFEPLRAIKRRISGLPS